MHIVYVNSTAVEKSRSQVERARLEIVYTPKGYRGFESLLLRQNRESLIFKGFPIFLCISVLPQLFHCALSCFNILFCVQFFRKLHADLARESFDIVFRSAIGLYPFIPTARRKSFARPHRRRSALWRLERLDRRFRAAAEYAVEAAGVCPLQYSIYAHIYFFQCCGCSSNYRLNPLRGQNKKVTDFHFNFSST